MRGQVAQARSFSRPDELIPDRIGAEAVAVMSEEEIGGTTRSRVVRWPAGGPRGADAVDASIADENTRLVKRFASTTGGGRRAAYRMHSAPAMTDPYARLTSTPVADVSPARVIRPLLTEADAHRTRLEEFVVGSIRTRPRYPCGP